MHAHTLLEYSLLMSSHVRTKSLLVFVRAVEKIIICTVLWWYIVRGYDVRCCYYGDSVQAVLTCSISMVTCTQDMLT